MSSSALVSSDRLVLTPQSEAGHDFEQHSRQLREALQRDTVDLQREVLLWQRWVRYAALGALALVSLVFGPASELALLPLTAVGGAYVAFVAGTAWYVQSTEGQAVRGWLPALLLAADIATLSALFYLSSQPAQFYRVLLVGLLSVQLSVFYFGRKQGVVAAALAIASYLVMSLTAPPFLPGPRPDLISVGFNTTLFVIVAAVLVHTFGGFRSRMNRLRLFCKLSEDGEIGGPASDASEKRPDDLTLLAQSLDAMRSRLAEQIGSDPLTGCLNRRTLEARLRADWRYAKRRGSSVAVMAIDVDHFKKINDARGHPVGDLVLQQLGGIMKSTARETDAVARFGGDEFVILLPDTAWQGALTLAERLRRHVDDYTFGAPGEPMTITVSIGVSLARGTDAIFPEVLLREADRSLYKAKSGGRNRVFA